MSHPNKRTPRLRPRFDEIVPLIESLYRRPGGGAGCCLHVVTDDLNLDDSFVNHCLLRAIRLKHRDCAELALWLRCASKTQRRRACSVADKACVMYISSPGEYFRITGYSAGRA